MGKVSNRFFITTIKDGQSLSAILQCTTTLSQYVLSDGGACNPNWNKGETGAVCPELWVYSRLDGELKAPTGQGDWYFNGVKIFNDSNVCQITEMVNGTEYPKFERTTHSHTLNGRTVSLPALRIIRNLGGGDNTDNDVISYEGSMDMGGVNQRFSLDTVVRISRLAGDGYQATAGGDRLVSSNSSSEVGYTARVYAQLWNGSDLVTGLTTKWYREGVDASSAAIASNGRWPRQGQYTANEQSTATATLPAKSYYTDINASEIDDKVTLRCDFYDASNNKVASVWWDVDDETDPEEMFIVNSTGSTVGQSDIQLRSGQSVVLKAWMGYSTDQYNRHPDYTTFKCKLTDSQGRTITEGAPISGTVDEDGFFDITKNDVTILDQNGNTLLAAGKGGQVEISAAFVDSAANGGLGGVITAS